MTLTLELPDDVMRKLASEAQAMQLSVEGLALLKLQRDMVAGGQTTLVTQVSDEEWAKVTSGVIHDYRELLERLA